MRALHHRRRDIEAVDLDRCVDPVDLAQQPPAADSNLEQATSLDPARQVGRDLPELDVDRARPASQS